MAPQALYIKKAILQSQKRIKRNIKRYKRLFWRIKLMEHECPCIDCICVPVCKRDSTVNLLKKCDLLKNFAVAVQHQIPRNSYRFITLEGIERRFEVINDGDKDGCRWRCIHHLNRPNATFSMPHC